MTTYFYKRHILFMIVHFCTSDLMKSTFPDFGIDFFIILATFAIGRNRSYKYIHTRCTTTTQQCKPFLSFPVAKYK